MQELELYQQNISTLDSREVAKLLGKRHSDLIRDIVQYEKYFNQNADLRFDDFFEKSTYVAGTGKTYKNYLITKKGCEFLAHKLTGQKGAIFTAKYIDAFDSMQNHIRLNTPLSTNQDPYTKAALAQILNMQQYIINALSQNQPIKLIQEKSKNKKRRKKFLIETLPLSVRKLVDTMITSDSYTYKDIQDNLKLMGYSISKSAIYNYKKYIEGVQND